MSNFVLQIISRYSSSALLGLAHGANLRGELSKSYNLSIDGLMRSTSKNDATYWSEFLPLAIAVGLKLQDERCFREISSIVLSNNCLELHSDVCEPLLKLSKWGYELNINDVSMKLIENAISADENNAKAWFFAGWMLLESDLDESVLKLRKCVALDARMISKIQLDEKCKKFLTEKSIELISRQTPV